jgi:ribosomal protein L29
MKAKELRKKDGKELMQMLSEIDRTIMRFKGGGVNWGLFQTLKKNRAVILTVLTEQRKITKPFGKQMVR